jgi:hypothetical protein
MVDLTDRRMLYYGLIHPFLTYGIVVWGQSAKALFKSFYPSKKGGKLYCRAKTIGIVPR